MIDNLFIFQSLFCFIFLGLTIFFLFIDSSCYAESPFTTNDGKEVLMGYTAACKGETTTAKDPSAFITFNDTSIMSGCVFINISIMYQVCGCFYEKEENE